MTPTGGLSLKGHNTNQRCALNDDEQLQSYTQYWHSRAASTLLVSNEPCHEYAPVLALRCGLIQWSFVYKVVLRSIPEYKTHLKCECLHTVQGTESRFTTKLSCMEPSLEPGTCDLIFLH